MPFIIDGHNLIAALPDIELSDPNDEVKLLVKLRMWAWRERKQAAVIFDGGILGGRSPALSGGGLEVVFAARGYTIADKIIMERLDAIPDPANWTVVSSDREVLYYAQLIGARTMTSYEFAEVLERPPESPEKPEHISQQEVAYWLDVFEAMANRTEDAEPRFPQPQPLHTTPDILAKQRSESPTTPKRPRPQKPALPIRKETERNLSYEEVARWMALFGDSLETEDEPPAEAESRPPSENRLRRPSHSSNARLREHKQRLIPIDEEPSSLSDDDLALWRQLYGRPH